MISESKSALQARGLPESDYSAQSKEGNGLHNGRLIPSLYSIFGPIAGRLPMFSESALTQNDILMMIPQPVMAPNHIN